jgi:hypothetical protein
LIENYKKIFCLCYVCTGIKLFFVKIKSFAWNGLKWFQFLNEKKVHGPFNRYMKTIRSYVRNLVV